MNAKNQKEAQTKLTKGLLDMIILQYLEKEGMHGYQLITSIRKGYGIYFGPSTVYPLLGQLEKKGYVKSAWNMTSERPRKVYQLTEQGKELLNATQNSLLMICQRISPELTVKTPQALILA
ncbi:MAG: PadR family transcriptional regulator [Candidatus Bathyarchaeota archaeon]|nr:PadR family transcriptional regulator [Candidatus Bathyarchaeota archaeon]